MNYVLKRTLTILLFGVGVMAVAGDKENISMNPNLLNNSSFETCGNPGMPDYWGTYHWGMWDELGAARFEQWQKQWCLDSTQHFDGKYSFRLSNDSSGTQMPYSLFLTSCQIHLTEPGDHVFSVYMKSDKADTPVIMELFNGYLGKLKSEGVKVGTEWQRYSTSIKIDGSMATASIHLKNSGVVWVDAAQFERGTQPTAYTRSFLDEPPVTGEAKCAPITEKPAIDGTLNDAQWQKTEKVLLKGTNGSDKIKAPTEVTFLADAENLYVGVKCVQPQMDKISKQPGPHDQLLWRPQDQLLASGGDVVEVFISPSADAVPYYHLVFDSVGNRFESKSGNTGWDGIWQVKTARSADGWTAEAVIPWSNFTAGQENISPVWRLNVCRENPFQGENLALFPTYAGFHTLSRLGKLSGIPADALNSAKLQISKIELTPCGLDKYIASVKLTNPTDRMRTLVLGAFLAVSDSYNGSSGEAKASIPPRGSVTVASPPLDFRASDKFAKLALIIRENGRQIASQVKSFAVSPFAGEAKIEYPVSALVLDGKPFLPISVYWDKTADLTADTLNVIKQLGFNTILIQVPGTAPEMIKILDMVQFAGLKCISEVRIKNADSKSVDFLRTTMETSKDSPAIIAWMVLDEPELIKGDYEMLSKEIYDIAKAADPCRPVYINHTTHQKFNRDVTGDISSVDIYPVPDQDYHVFSELIENMKVSGKPVWMWLQSTGNAYFYYREPTVDEFRVMTLSCLLKGASGLHYFANLPHSAQLRKNMPELFGMISKYAPIFLSPPMAGTADADMDGTLITSWRRCNGKTYLLVLNAASTALKATIDTSIMTGARKAVNLQDKSVLQIKDAALHDDLKPFQFKIYQVEE